MRRILFVLLGAMMFGAPGLAADMPVKSAPAPVAASAYNWTGFYLGLEGGWGELKTRHINATPLIGSETGTARIDGGVFGATYGYNFQAGPWLLGFEGDISWSGIKDHFTGNPNPSFCPSNTPCLTDLRWLGTDRLRAGYVWDRLLVYGTFGIAYGRVAATIEAPAIVSGSSWRSAPVFGGGLEWAFSPNWSVKAEYLRINDFGDKPTYDGGLVVSVRDVNIVRVGVNYLFAGPAGR